VRRAAPPGRITRGDGKQDDVEGRGEHSGFPGDGGALPRLRIGRDPPGLLPVPLGRVEEAAAQDARPQPAPAPAPGLQLAGRTGELARVAGGGPGGRGSDRRGLLRRAGRRGAGRLGGDGLPVSLTGALLADRPGVDEVHLTAERVLVVNTSPVRGGERRGTVVTLRDRTDLQALTGELDSVRGFAEALRSQAHEAANRLHTVVSLIELGRAEDAVDFATAELRLAQALTDQVVAAVGEPVLAALLLGKAAEAHERGVELTVTEDSRIDDGVLPAALAARDVVTVLGNLIDNAIDAAIEGAGRDGGADGGVDGHGADADGGSGGRDARGGGRPAVTVVARTEADELLLRVTDSGRGVDPATVEEVFRRGWTTKSEGHGLGLALVEQAARRAGGTVTLDRAGGGGARFTVRLPLRPGRPLPEEARA
jgi:two-component system CitB family sensor kinase